MFTLRFFQNCAVRFNTNFRILLCTLTLFSVLCEKCILLLIFRMTSSKCVHSQFFLPLLSYILDNRGSSLWFCFQNCAFNITHFQNCSVFCCCFQLYFFFFFGAIFRTVYIDQGSYRVLEKSWKNREGLSSAEKVFKNIGFFLHDLEVSEFLKTPLTCTVQMSLSTHCSINC